MPQPCPDQNPLKRDGLNQPQRKLAALQPAYVRLDERELQDLLAFTARYAEVAKVRFFDLSDLPDNGEAWAELMKYPNFLKLPELEQRHDIEPHFALFLTFLHLFGFLQDHLNTLTKRHLDFYYQEVLRLSNRPPVPDRVYVLFELARNAAEQIVPGSTELDAGRDLLKKPLIYATTEERVVNRAAITHLRTIYIHPEDHKVYHAPAANTQDGVAEPLDKDHPTWNAFGPKLRPLPSCDPTKVPVPFTLPEARLGFALASPVLLLAEGNREIAVKLTSSASLPAAVQGIRLSVQLSGEKAWIEAGEASLSISGGALSFTVTLPAAEKAAVVPFNPAKLDGGFQTTSPVMRCWLRDTASHASLSSISLTQAEIKVAVSQIKKSLLLENDLGKVSPEKPFMPFGPTPAVGSVLYVNCPEALAKKLETVTVKLPDWVGKPENWSSHYAAYANKYKNQNNIKATAEVLNGNLKGQMSSSRSLFSSFSSESGVSVPETSTGAAGTASYLGPVRQIGFHQKYVHAGGSFVAFTPSVMVLPAVAAKPQSVSDSLLKITLNQSLGHPIYPQLLTQNIVDRIADTSIAIPNPPYTPVAKELLLSYTASSGEVSLTADTFEAFASRPLQLFHLAAFGQAEEHAFLKKHLGFLPNTEKTTALLLPRYPSLGTFLVGLAGIGPSESLSLLFQVAEGSANPERAVPEVRWSVLCQNQWQLLGVEHLLADGTHSLLTSGIIQFYLPPETNADNTLLEPGYVWLKAELFAPREDPAAALVPAPIDSVSHLVAVHPQAVEAIFRNQDNAPAHYAAPLPAESIRKTRQSLAAIKAVKQPYPSFGGQAREEDQAFYTRVSERLRHKQRAVTIWDYEHLVLQRFPAVYKIKCLNHTRLAENGSGSAKLKELAPGHVTVVVVPDLRNANAPNPLEPKVDLNTLSQIRQFLQHHAGQHVGLQVTNPAYERVRLSFQVAFRRGFPFATYRKVLLQAIIAYLSPWAFDSSADIPFGGTVQKSVLIHYLERLPYVDFITRFEMKQLIPGSTTPDDSEVISASDARAVLVSCDFHDIREFSGC